jgi:hypothetical protein
MNRMLVITIALGALISTLLLVMESLSDHSIFWMGLEMPGISAAYLFWGAVGSSVFLGVAISWFVNAIVYGLGAFVIIGALKIVSTAARKISN